MTPGGAFFLLLRSRCSSFIFESFCTRDVRCWGLGSKLSFGDLGNLRRLDTLLNRVLQRKKNQPCHPWYYNLDESWMNEIQTTENRKPNSQTANGLSAALCLIDLQYLIPHNDKPNRQYSFYHIINKAYSIRWATSCLKRSSSSISSGCKLSGLTSWKKIVEDQ